MRLPPDYEWKDWSASDEPPRDDISSGVRFFAALVVIAMIIGTLLAMFRPAPPRDPSPVKLNGAHAPLAQCNEGKKEGARCR